MLNLENFSWHGFCMLASMSLFEGLNIATRGLAAAQLGLNVTGQNVTNAGTEGYSRKRIEQSAAYKKDGSFGQMGFGVEVYSINRIRDQFIDRLVNQESTRYGFYEMKSRAFTRIEDIFGEQHEHKALNDLLNDFWNGWADLADNPESLGAREAMRFNAQTLAGQFNYLATQLRDYKDIINDEIEDRVKKINQITEGIYRCNMVIASSENTLGNKANDTRDQRDALLQELASLVDVDYFEDEQGILNVSSGGGLLVSAARNHELVANRINMTQQDGYQFARVEVSFASSRKAFEPKSGELRALMDTRDVHIPAYQNYIDDIARTLITEVNKIHQGGYGLAADGKVGLSFMEFFSSDPNHFSAANIQISTAVKESVNNIAAGLGGTLVDVLRLTNDPDKVPPDFTLTVDTAYQYAQDEPYRSVPIFLQNMNHPDSGKFTFLQKGSLVIEVRDPNIPADSLASRRLVEGQDYVVDYSNGKITFIDNALSQILGDPNATPPTEPMTVEISFKYAENGYAGPGDGQNALLLSQLRDQTVMTGDFFGKNTQTMNQFYAGTLGLLGAERNDADAGLDTRTYALAFLKERQQEVMGVEIDEEMTNLIKYQHSYTASARYLTTINTMLETLLNM
jgi:flagellar hook-associated protein 1 FlgK